MNILGWIDPLPYQRMARRGRSALAGGVDNHLDLDVLDTPVAWLQQNGLRCCGAQNWWGRSNVPPHQDATECDTQVLWAIDWSRLSVFYSGGVALSLNPGGLYAFHDRELHGIYNARGGRWSAIVFDVERF